MSLRKVTATEGSNDPPNIRHNKINLDQENVLRRFSLAGIGKGGQVITSVGVNITRESAEKPAMALVRSNDSTLGSRQLHEGVLPSLKIPPSLNRGSAGVKSIASATRAAAIAVAMMETSRYDFERRPVSWS